jgi:hypothetical protein
MWIGVHRPAHRLIKEQREQAPVHDVREALILGTRHVPRDHTVACPIALEDECMPMGLWHRTRSSTRSQHRSVLRVTPAPSYGAEAVPVRSDRPRLVLAGESYVAMPFFVPLERGTRRDVTGCIAGERQRTSGCRPLPSARGTRHRLRHQREDEHAVGDRSTERRRERVLGVGVEGSSRAASAYASTRA